MARRLAGAQVLVAGLIALSVHAHAQEPLMKIAPPANMTRLGTIDERYQSYNIEMLEVTGGKFWKPYGSAITSSRQPPQPPSPAGDTPAGMDPGAYEYRPPIDLTNARRGKLAAALGSAYVRVSGTW